jgi:hypothetical protein
MSEGGTDVAASREEVEAALAYAQGYLSGIAAEAPATNVADLVSQIDRYRAFKAAVREWQSRLDMKAFEEGRMTLSEAMQAADDRSRASPTA